MAVPEGYTFLAKLGISYKGDYAPDVQYKRFDAVYYNGSTYIALVDNPSVEPNADGQNWQYMAQGFLSQLISSLTAVDTNGVIGDTGENVNAQELLDGMSNELTEKLNRDGGDSKNVTTSFEQASKRSNIGSGENHSILFSKIKKWFADMTAAAFAQIISNKNDLMANTKSGYLPDSLAVKDAISSSNTEISNVNKKLTLSRLDNVKMGIASNGEYYIQFIVSDTQYRQLTFKSDSIEYGEQSAGEWKRIWIIQ